MINLVFIKKKSIDYRLVNRALQYLNLLEKPIQVINTCERENLVVIFKQDILRDFLKKKLLWNGFA